MMQIVSLPYISYISFMETGWSSNSQKIFFTVTWSVVFVFLTAFLLLIMSLQHTLIYNYIYIYFFIDLFELFFLNLFIYFWLCWVFVSVRGLSLVAASGGHSSSRCAGLSLSRPSLLRSIGSRRAGSVVVAHGPSCFVACGIFPDQGLNPCPLHWQADSQPLRHQGSPYNQIYF